MLVLVFLIGLLGGCTKSTYNPADPSSLDFHLINLIGCAISPVCGYDVSIYVVGSRQFVATNRDWWIKKYNAAGAEVTGWDKVFDAGNNADDSALAVTTDLSGNVYVGGRWNRASTGNDWHIKKFSAAGVEDTANWSKTFDGGNSADDQLFGLACDASGNLYAVGYATQATTAVDWWIKKFSSDGIEDTTNWNKTFDGGNNGSDAATSVAIAADGSVFVVGRRFQAGTGNDWWIKKFSADGTEDTVSWNKTFDAGNSGSDQPTRVRLDAAGNVYVAGWGNRAGTQQDWWIKKFSADGTEDTTNWNKFFDGGSSVNDFLRALAVDASGNIYAAGRMQPPASNMQWTIKKFSAGGTEDLTSWNKSDDGGTSGLDDVFGMGVDQTGNLYAGGLRTPTGGTGEDWWVRKYNSDGSEVVSGWNHTLDGGASLAEAVDDVFVSVRR